ncbi:hypothetical protein OPKNFCMD_3680 [Methylobacterium crusticola]|uniref:Cobalt transporter n=1 Tax=Methylobacterium crusticola TaxID=1697972 RepID=A0ABQ4R265_9HYPH|nr:CbtA family protein [Methylobacterium crusticola]GJD50931.1 hypothetical protein OPKNFCMD_3680 [Methylobacterium crusticola]
MTKRLLSAALVAGFLAACVTSVLQFALTSPLILAAEKYEEQAGLAPAGPGLPGLPGSNPGLPGSNPGLRGGNPLLVLAHAGHDHAPEGAGAAAAWQPAPGLPRMAFTALATLVSGVGYALLLGAVLLADRRTVTSGEALRFAVGGFLAASLAPAVGLPPELPGMAAAALESRQAWWAATVAATGLGLYLAAIRRGPAALALGLALIAAPHVWGAPRAPEAASALPAAYAAQFAARSLAVAFAFWAVLGLGFGWAWTALGSGRSAAPGTA